MNWLHGMSGAFQCCSGASHYSVVRTLHRVDQQQEECNCSCNVDISAQHPFDDGLSRCRVQVCLIMDEPYE